MAADVGMDWDALLQQSEELAAGDSAAAAAFPRVERDLLQVEAYASALRARLARADGRGDAAAAARLLAHEGVNTRKLTRALQHFELRPSHEDAAALASEASTVEEFVSRAHEAAVVAAIAQAQQDAAVAADSFLDAAEEKGWGSAKGALFGLAASVAAAAAAAAAGGAAGAGNDDGAAVGEALALPAASPPPPGLGGRHGGENALLPARTRLYSRVLAEMNEAAAAGKAFDAVGAFGKAAAEASSSSSSAANGGGAGGGGSASSPPPPPGLRMMWDILARQASALASPAATALGDIAAKKASEQGEENAAATAAAAASAAAAALVLGGRRYLSECFVSYVEATVRKNRAAASLGGSPSREALLRAYLRVKEGRGIGGAGGSEVQQQQLALDFDAPGGADTRWQRLYYALRAGFVEEAKAAAVGIAGPSAPATVAEALGGGGGSGGGAGAAGMRPLSGLDALPCAVEAWLSSSSASSSSSSLDLPAVPAAAASALAAEAERTLRAAGVGIGGGGGVSVNSSSSSSPWLSPAFRARVGVLALLSSDARCAAAVAREGAALFPTIEDFLWFHGGLVRVDASLAAAVVVAAASKSGGGGGVEGAAAASAAASAAAAAAAAESSVADSYTLPTLQSHISRFGAAHFSAGGRDPFLYAAVLLLSAQPKAAVAFLAKDPLARGGSGGQGLNSSSSTAGGRSDAPHLAAALAASRLIEGGGPGDAGASAGAAASPAPLLRAWGRSLAAVDPAAALEYYVAAAAAGGGSLALRAALLRELLLASSGPSGTGGGGSGGGAFGRLLGGGGVGAAARADGGPLARFAGPGGGPEERAALLAAVGAGCEAAGEVDWAAELYSAAGSPEDSLRLLCGALGDALSSSSSAAAADGGAAESLERIIIRGNDAAAALSSASGAAGASSAASSSSFAVLDLWRQLLAARDLLAAASLGDPVSALRALDSLPCIPQDAHRVQRCADSLPSLPGPLARLLSSLLVAGGRAAAAAGDRARLRAMASFAAAAAPTRVARSAFEELNSLHDRLNLPA